MNRHLSFCAAAAVLGLVASTDYNKQLGRVTNASSPLLPPPRDEKEAERMAWNAEVDRKKAEKKARKMARAVGAVR